CAAANVSSGVRPQEPRRGCSRQYNECCEPPTVIGRAGPPCAGQDQQRRDDRQKEEDVIEIQNPSKKIRRVTLLEGIYGSTLPPFYSCNISDVFNIQP